jgi:hypothetical protein
MRFLSAVKLAYQGVGGIGAVPFHGVGGIGAVPFFHGVGGIGAVPFFQGVGGIGAVPLAINTEESPWVVTTVFRPIAPVKTSMARTIADVIRDIVPPGTRTTQSALYPLIRQSQGLTASNWHTPRGPSFSISFRLSHNGANARHFGG